VEFLLLLIALLAIASIIAWLVVIFFRNPIDSIFNRVIGESIAGAWRKFITFALFVVGISSGVDVWKLERFLQPATEKAAKVELTPEYWGLEIYHTIIGTLGGMAWALLLLFLAMLIAFLIVRRQDSRRTEKSNVEQPAPHRDSPDY